MRLVIDKKELELLLEQKKEYIGKARVNRAVIALQTLDDTISSTGSCGKCYQIECNFTGYKKYADDSGSII